MLRYIAIFLFALTLYLIFTGSLRLYDIFTGLIIALLVSSLCGKYLVKRESKLSFRRLALFIAFLAKYIVTEAKAHIDVTRRIISARSSAINPGIVRVRYSVSTDYAVTMIANSITNTPGTVVVDIDPENKYLYVHWLYVKTYKEDEIQREILSFYEIYAQRVFD